ncbi:serine hydrolase domain-containing protein [Deinococcus roseus]|uniref:Beta-lactamase-related domain-containing protein n=1 Tax=Deinococcus roseus TaxID=392414 RepID=A0ABQ2CTR1_9DEIO|nr:serine hydrolase domain-containing protein [Deinococcus roseus]GGJ20134.1 hypothetical protein GCM10008938_02880 [Deinococcus roseus]
MNIPELAQKLFEPFQSKTAGNAVAVLWQNELVYQHTAGRANQEKYIPVTPDTLFCIGSITKTMTAIHIMQQVEAGRIALDDPIRKHLKSIPIAEPYINNPIRVRHLLTHTSGLGYFRSWKDILLPAGGLGALKNTPTLTEYYRDGLTPIYPPLTRWAYCNHAFALLGQLIEDVTGQPFETTFTAEVLRKSGMVHATLQRPENTELRAMPYMKSDSKSGAVYKPSPDLDIVVKPAGSVYASITDMVAYARTLLAHSSPLLTRESHDQMHSRQFEVNPDLMGMGLGFVLLPFGEKQVSFHTGGWLGYNSSMHICPELGAAVITLSNSENPEVMSLGEQFFKEALQIQPTEAAGVPVEDLQFARSYGEPVKGLERVIALLTQPGGLKLIRKEGQLHLKTLTGPWRKGIALKPRGGSLFEIADPQQPMLCNLEISGQRVTALHLGLNRLAGQF